MYFDATFKIVIFKPDICILQVILFIFLIGQLINMISLNEIYVLKLLTAFLIDLSSGSTYLKLLPDKTV